MGVREGHLGNIEQCLCRRNSCQDMYCIHTSPRCLSDLHSVSGHHSMSSLPSDMAVRTRSKSAVLVISPEQSRVFDSPSPRSRHSCLTSCSSFSFRATKHLHHQSPLSQSDVHGRLRANLRGVQRTLGAKETDIHPCIPLCIRVSQVASYARARA